MLLHCHSLFEQMKFWMATNLVGAVVFLSEVEDPSSSFQIEIRQHQFMATNSDESSNADQIVKKCPICFGGIIEFDGDSVGDYGECNNEQTHEDRYAGFEITKKEPFTVKYEQGPLHTYTVPARIPDWAFGEGGLKFSLRDDGNGSTWEELRDAVLLTLEGLSDWMSDVVDTIEWDGVDWDEYEEKDDGITEYVLEGVE